MIVTELLNVTINGAYSAVKATTVILHSLSLSHVRIA